ncbi:hypothetical protein [Lysinibacillus cavernae]|uniref:hypothetical protein n=1 Tax=Lysinibacillus cavernae TaxID=2666135 RepID=UPI0012D89755|nr:hypothetical protein [Lysinibacillus cavernae]
MLIRKLLTFANIAFILFALCGWLFAMDRDDEVTDKTLNVMDSLLKVTDKTPNVMDSLSNATDSNSKVVNNRLLFLLELYCYDKVEVIEDNAGG